ncbi:MAG: CDP-diacylglycerol--glycerol-3-phosphate 3-phosphatidyltransferase [Erysipelothrix sp.]|nr:CDP-diacylglycerol--glycerol-3-phosphate 3-phosphatidyltransferase [Erysipelothrix sp.]
MNLPNKLSLFRMGLIPLIVLIKVFPYAQFNYVVPVFDFGGYSLSLLNIVILVLFVIASLTDYVDGYIARKYNLITTFGKFIDPIADKLLVTTMFILFAVDGIVPIVVVLIMLWRDILVDGLRMIASSEGIVMSAGYLGKLKTVLQMLAIIVILLNNLPFEMIAFPMANFLLWFALVASVLSGISYFIQGKAVLLNSK